MWHLRVLHPEKEQESKWSTTINLNLRAHVRHESPWVKVIHIILFVGKGAECSVVERKLNRLCKMSVFRASSSKVSMSTFMCKCHTLSTCSVRPRSSLSSWPLSTRRSLSIITYLKEQNSGKRETSSNRRQVLVVGVTTSTSWLLQRSVYTYWLRISFHVDHERCTSCSRSIWRRVKNRPQISFYYVISPTSVLMLPPWRRRLQ